MLFSKKQQKISEDGTCDRCNGSVPHGEGYAFYSSALTYRGGVVGNMLICKDCCNEVMTEQAFSRKTDSIETEETEVNRDPQTEEDFLSLIKSKIKKNDRGIIKRCKALGLSPIQAKRKARQLAIAFWKNPEKGELLCKESWTKKN